jgi:magnesium transporter
MPGTRCYRSGVLEAEDFPIDEVSEHLDDGGLVWVDLCRPDKAELELLASELGLHELAVEDALHDRQRPKVDMYATHVFLSAYAVDLNLGSGELSTSEIAIFVMKQALVTVRKSDTFDMTPIVARWDNSPDLMKHGVGALLYGVLDHVVDGHFATVNELDEQIEKLEDFLFDQHSNDVAVQRRSFELRKSLVRLRRVVLPMREAVNALMRRDLHIVSEEMTPYFQDVYDHVLRASEWTESLRDLVSTILETHLTIQGNRLNVITKKVTSWAAIIAVPTAITGFYGQNLPYPGFAKNSGLLASSLLIVFGSVGLYILFKRKDWL